jgi:hypothetical protein
MSSRISYTDPDENGICYSVREFTSKKSGAIYTVKLDIKNKKYTIIHKESRHYYAGPDNINNLNVLKRNVKKRLINMGVDFEPERRDRTFGLCKKGYNQEEHINNLETKNLPD